MIYKSCCIAHTQNFLKNKDAGITKGIPKTEAPNN